MRPKVTVTVNVTVHKCLWPLAWLAAIAVHYFG
jgi:hypothetical protein